MFIETSGRGTHVVLLHGTLEPPDVFRPLAHELAEDHSVHLVHRSGHGRASSLGAYSIANDVDGLVDYLRDVGADAYTLVGSGEGSYLAFSVAADARVPVRSVVALAPYAGNDPRYQAFARDVARRLPGDSGDLASELRAFAEAPSLAHALTHAATPTELLVGELDERVSIDSVFRLATAMPHATLEVVPERGHFLVAEDRERCASTCRQAADVDFSETPQHGLTGLSRDT